MSLNTIQIPAIILKDLYKVHLVDLTPGNSNLTSAATPTIPVLGNNRKKITLIVNDPDSIYLPDEELNFLLGILTACKLSMADIALLNYPKNPGITYREIFQQLAADKVILLGVSPAELQLPLEFPYYQLQQFNNQTYLYSPPLRTIREDKAEKTKLWACLKKLFAIP